MFGKLFGSRKKNAVAEALAATEPFIRTLAHSGGVPRGFWEDSYALGFLSGCIGLFAKKSAKGDMHGEELGLVIVDTLKALSGQTSLDVARRVTELQKMKDRSFISGMEKAYKCVLYPFDVQAFEGDQDVVEAKRIAEAEGEEAWRTFGTKDKVGIVNGIMLEQLFYKEIRRRLGKSA